MILARDVTEGARRATALPSLGERLAADPGLIRYAHRLILTHGAVPRPQPGPGLMFGHVGRRKLRLEQE